MGNARDPQAARIEAGGGGANEERWAQLIATGLRRALGITGVLTVADLPAVISRYATGAASSLRANAPGLYLPVLREDDVARVVPMGTVIGFLIDPVTNAIIETFRAPFEQSVMLLLRPTLAVMEGGEMVCVVGDATQAG